ncbi:YidH family protein [Thermoleptolyngbya sp.]
MPDAPRNLTNELAKERNRAAAERTLLAWIRTSLSLIGFGFGIDQIVAAIQRTRRLDDLETMYLARIIGLAFIAVGLYAVLSAAIEHRWELRRIQRDDYLYTPRRSNALAVAIALMVIGIFAFLGILISTLN